MSEMAQGIINAAGGKAAMQHFTAIERLPRWKRWLLRRLTPPYPLIRAELPAGPITLTKPLDVPPGVAIIGAWFEPASEAAAMRG